MRTAVDTNILLDVLLPDATHEKKSLALLHRAAYTLVKHPSLDIAGVGKEI